MLTLHGAFGKYVRARMDDLGLSTYDVARQSGGAITHQTVWSILNARAKDIKLSTLLGLARGLRVSEEELFDAVRGKTRRDQPPEELRAAVFFRELPPERQGDALRLLETLHQQHVIKPAEVKVADDRKKKTRRTA